jgi:hypothetical protein
MTSTAAIEMTEVSQHLGGRVRSPRLIDRLPALGPVVVLKYAGKGFAAGEKGACPLDSLIFRGE